MNDHTPKEFPENWREIITEHIQERIDHFESERRNKSTRPKASYVGVPAIFELELACQHLYRAFGNVCYLVGSAIERPDWRDIDIVMIMDDEEFAAEFPAATAGGCHWEFDPKWLIMTIAISKWLSAQCGHLVDFKFQPRTHANERHKGRRHAMGLIFAVEKISKEDV